MKEVRTVYDQAEKTDRDRRRSAWQHGVSRMAVLAICTVLLMPGIASAKKPASKNPVDSEAGCVIFPPAYIDTGHEFTLKIVRDPSYTGVWSQPTVDVAAVFTKNDGGEITVSYSETTSRYGVTYITTTPLTAPSNCNSDSVCDEINTSVSAKLTAVVKEPINKGKRFRETICTPVTASVNPAS